jgi:hypothetical protein
MRYPWRARNFPLTLPPPPGDSWPHVSCARGFYGSVTSHLKIAILEAKGCRYAPRQTALGSGTHDWG